MCTRELRLLDRLEWRDLNYPLIGQSLGVSSIHSLPDIIGLLRLCLAALAQRPNQAIPMPKAVRRLGRHVDQLTMDDLPPAVQDEP